MKGIPAGCSALRAGQSTGIAEFGIADVRTASAAGDGSSAMDAWRVGSVDHMTEVSVTFVSTMID